jgi:hypothetical protein
VVWFQNECGFLCQLRRSRGMENCRLPGEWGSSNVPNPMKIQETGWFEKQIAISRRLLSEPISAQGCEIGVRRDEFLHDRLPVGAFVFERSLIWFILAPRQEQRATKIFGFLEERKMHTQLHYRCHRFSQRGSAGDSRESPQKRKRMLIDAILSVKRRFFPMLAA